MKHEVRPTNSQDDHQAGDLHPPVYLPPITQVTITETNLHIISHQVSLSVINVWISIVYEYCNLYLWQPDVTAQLPKLLLFTPEPQNEEK